MRRARGRSVSVPVCDACTHKHHAGAVCRQCPPGQGCGAGAPVASPLPELDAAVDHVKALISTLRTAAERAAGAGADRAAHIVAVMNELLAADPQAVTALVSARVPCNKALADHPTCQVGLLKGTGGGADTWEVGLLGVLNALAGARPDGWGFVVATTEDAGGAIARFEVMTDELLAKAKGPEYQRRRADARTRGPGLTA